MSNRREDECYECTFTPNYHSFHLLNENNEQYYFYSCPSETDHYNDPEGLIKHIRLEIDDINKPWIWIFNAEFFGLKHVRCKRLHTQLMNLLSEYAHISLKNIIVINQNLTFKTYLRTCWYYIPPHLREKIIFDVKNNFSSLLNIDNSLHDLHTKLTF